MRFWLNCALVTVILLFQSLPLPAQEQAAPAGPALLFLNTAPINAEVVQDGQLLLERTPLLLRDLAPGKHTFRLRKEGRLEGRVTVEVVAGQIASQDVRLQPRGFRATFPEEENVVLGRTEEPSKERMFELPAGSYRVRRQGEALQVQPIYPGQGLINGLTIALPISLGFAGVLTAYDLVNGTMTDFPLSPATMSAYGISATVAVLDLALLLGKAGFNRRFSYQAVAAESSEAAAARLYQHGEDRLAQGKLEEALRAYADVISGHQDSPFLPYALFKTAKIHFLTRDDNLAEQELLLIVERYPQVDLYDKAQKALADVYLRQDAFPESLARLGAMVFADPLYTREEIEYYRARILERWYAARPQEELLGRVTAAYGELVDRYPASDSLPIYRYRLAHYLRAAGKGEEALRELNRIDLDKADPELKEQIQALRGELEGGS